MEQYLGEWHLMLPLKLIVDVLHMCRREDHQAEPSCSLEHQSPLGPHEDPAPGTSRNRELCSPWSLKAFQACLLLFLPGAKGSVWYKQWGQRKNLRMCLPASAKCSLLWPPCMWAPVFPQSTPPCCWPWQALSWLDMVVVCRRIHGERAGLIFIFAVSDKPWDSILGKCEKESRNQRWHRGRHSHPALVPAPEIWGGCSSACKPLTGSPTESMGVWWSPSELHPRILLWPTCSAPSLHSEYPRSVPTFVAHSLLAMSRLNNRIWKQFQRSPGSVLLLEKDPSELGFCVLQWSNLSYNLASLFLLKCVFF